MTTTAPPLTMRAWTHSTPGPPSRVLTLSPSLPLPTLLDSSPTSILIRLTHAALNPGASIIMHLCPSLLRSSLFSIPELDFSGHILQLGPDVPISRDLHPGTAVFGSVPVGMHVRQGVGALVEYIVVPADCVMGRPEGWSAQRAAGLAVVGCTALELMRAAGIKKGDRVLVNGASGGVGSVVVQFAREAVGKEEEGGVVGVCSGGNGELVRGLGVDEVIDYVAHAPVHEYLAAKYSKKPFDVIIDAYGVQELFNHCPSYLAPGKPFVTVGIATASYSFTSLLYAGGCMLQNMLWPRLLGGVNRPYVQITALATLAGMQKLVELAEEDCFDIVIDSCWDMEDALKAYERMLSKRARGKVIVKIQDP